MENKENKKTLLVVNHASHDIKKLTELARKYKDNLYVLYLISNSTRFLRDPWIGDNISFQKNRAVFILDNIIHWLEISEKHCYIKTGFEIPIIQQIIEELNINKIIAEPQLLRNYNKSQEDKKIKKQIKNVIVKLWKKRRIENTSIII